MCSAGLAAMTAACHQEAPAMIAVPVSLPTPLSYRPREAARLLGVSARTLYEWTRAGRVRCVRVGPGKRAAVLYPVDALRQLLAAPAVPSSTN